MRPPKALPGLGTYRRVGSDRVFCADDLLAVMSALRVGISSQRRVVIGFDDIPGPAQMPVPLTTIRQPMDELSEAAARLLLSGADAPAAPDLGPVTIRESAGPR